MRIIKSVAAAAAATAFVCAGAAQAQEFKDVKVPQTINVVVAYSAGGSSTCWCGRPCPISSRRSRN